MLKMYGCQENIQQHTDRGLRNTNLIVSIIVSIIIFILSIILIVYLVSYKKYSESYKLKKDMIDMKNKSEGYCSCNKI